MLPPVLITDLPPIPPPTPPHSPILSSQKYLQLERDVKRFTIQARRQIQDAFELNCLINLELKERVIFEQGDTKTQLVEVCEGIVNLQNSCNDGQSNLTKTASAAHFFRHGLRGVQECNYFCDVEKEIHFLKFKKCIADSNEILRCTNEMMSILGKK